MERRKQRLEFFLPFDKVPTTTHQQHRVASVKGRIVVYKGEKLQEAYEQLLNALLPWRPKEPCKGPIRLIAKWIFKPPARIKGTMPQWKDTRPDTDNLQKMLKDIMTKLGYWEDDAQVVSEIVEKFWHRPSGIYIKIEELEHEAI